MDRAKEPFARDAHESAIVWLVDDSPFQTEAGRRALAPSFDVKTFVDGAAMLEQLAAGPAPDLLVLDWHMPNLSGLEICQFVRQTWDAALLPILILTGNASAETVVEALRAGANDFVLQPARDSELRARATALLRNKTLHTALAETERQLRVEAEFRERFIGMLAHDLRQPLNTFVLANESLMGLGEPNTLLQAQRRAAERMRRMVSELLDFARSRPESGIPIQREPVDLALLIAELLQEIRISHPDRVFELTVDGACFGPWDRDRLAQLCGNLLGNAIEHGAAGASIGVHLQRQADSVALSVSNRGEPIPAHALATVFQPFRRGPGARTSGGVGLGLHIVSQIARAHGGDVTVTSDHEATVFRVTLPLDA